MNGWPPVPPAGGMTARDRNGDWWKRADNTDRPGEWWLLRAGVPSPTRTDADLLAGGITVLVDRDGTVLVTPEPTARQRFDHDHPTLIERATASIADRLGDNPTAADRIELALLDHWKTTGVWGGQRVDVCGRCAYTDGAHFRWPCPTRQALTGEPAPGLPVPTAVPTVVPGLTSGDVAEPVS